MVLCSHWRSGPSRWYFSFLLPFMTTGYLCSYRTTEVISHYAIWRMHNYERIVCNLFIRWDSPVIKSTAASFPGKPPFFFFFPFCFCKGWVGGGCAHHASAMQEEGRAGQPVCGWQAVTVQFFAARGARACRTHVGLVPLCSGCAGTRSSCAQLSPALILPELFITSLCAAPARGTWRTGGCFQAWSLASSLL